MASEPEWVRADELQEGDIVWSRGKPHWRVWFADVKPQTVYLSLVPLREERMQLNGVVTPHWINRRPKRSARYAVARAEEVDLGLDDVLDFLAKAAHPSRPAPPKRLPHGDPLRLIGALS